MQNKYLVRGAKKRHNRISVILVIIVVLLLAVVIAVGKHNIKVKMADNIKRKQALQTQIDEEKARTSEIEEYAKYIQTKKYVEEVAKEKLGLVKDDEILFQSENEK